MNSITKFSCEDIAGAEISCVIAQGEPWFKAKDIVAILGYGNAKRAAQTNVDDEDKKQLEDFAVPPHGSLNCPMEDSVAKDKKQFKDLDVPRRGAVECPLALSSGALANAVFVDESGLYSLISRSRKPEENVFKHLDYKSRSASNLQDWLLQRSMRLLAELSPNWERRRSRDGLKSNVWP